MNKILRAEPLVFACPMWQFMMPARLQGFMERAFTRFHPDAASPRAAGLLKGKTARIIRAMGMLGFICRLLFMTHGAEALKAMLSFCGLSPAKTPFFGNREGSAARRRAVCLETARELGKEAA